MAEISTQIVNCPICRKPTPWDGNPNRPFCSPHCKMVDLGRWLGEEYTLTGEPTATAVEDSGQTRDR